MIYRELDNQRVKLYSIGEAADLCHVSIKTLRHYDVLDLLKPAYVDPESNRRYYTEIQLYHLFMIKKLKALKFSLDEIKEISFNKRFTSGIQLFENRLKENQEEIEKLRKSNKDLRSWISLLDWFQHHDLSALDEQVLQLKEIPERKIVFSRAASPFNHESIFIKNMELASLIDDYQLQEKDWYLFLIHDPLDKLNMESLDIEIARIVDDNTDETLPFVHKIPLGKYLSMIHKGSLRAATDKIQRLIQWCEQNFYRIAGPLIALYIVPLGWVKTPQELVIELQVQVEKLTDV